jgi:hypothetical protein
MTDVTGSWWHLAMLPAAPVQDHGYTRRTRQSEQEGGNPVNAMTGNYPAEMRASDADRDAVLAELSSHFQAGRLTAAELDERTGQALTARTWGELGKLMADLPASRPASRAPARASSTVQPEPARHPAPPLLASLAGITVTVAVLIIVTHAGWGLIWPLLAVLFIVRPMIRRLRPGIMDPRTR